MEAKEKSSKRTIILIILILILLIIIFFLLINCMGKIENNVKIPTGNIDIFDIVFSCCHENSENCTCNKKNNNYSSNDNSTNSENGFIIYDNEVKYSKENTPLNIFTQVSYYVVNGTIAPGSENSYQFIIRNNNKFNIKYNLEIIEENQYNINMKFKLKQNGKYVAGSDTTYVSASELNQYLKSLSSKNYDVYTLEWKWLESENDTQIGTNINSNYALNLKMLASQY